MKAKHLQHDIWGQKFSISNLKSIAGDLEIVAASALLEALREFFPLRTIFQKDCCYQFSMVCESKSLYT